MNNKNLIYYIETLVNNSDYLVKYNHYTVVKMYHSKRYLTIDFYKHTMKCTYSSINNDLWNVYKKFDYFNNNEFLNFNYKESSLKKGEIYPI